MVLPYLKLETGSNGSTVDSWSRSYAYYQAISIEGEGDASYEERSFVGGSETENGFIRSFGPDWTFFGETIDPVAHLEILFLVYRKMRKRVTGF